MKYKDMSTPKLMRAYRRKVKSLFYFHREQLTGLSSTELAAARSIAGILRSRGVPMP